MNRKHASALLQPIGQLVDFIRNGLAAVTGQELGTIRSNVRSESLLAYELHELEVAICNGPLLSVSDLPAYMDAVKSLNGTGMDDRLHLLEKLLVLMSRLSESSNFGKIMESAFIDMLYKDLPHPPFGYLAPPAYPCRTAVKQVSYAFRTVDGSYQNPYFPFLGQAGTPYVRSVPPFRAVSISSLPDPGLVFNMLLRRDGFKPHPGGLSSLFFAFANIITHDIFNTSRENSKINDASSYLDLSPLYGSSQEQLDQVRRKDGTGRLWEDVFADDRLLLMPPAVSALIILLNRNHNFIAEKILGINEHGNYSPPNLLSNSECALQDDEIFERARLVNCGFLIQIVLHDYIGAILALVQDGREWRLDPLKVMRDVGHEFRSPGQGNAVSIEFNHLYRWHTTISAQDTNWLESLFKRIFGPDVDFGSITAGDFKDAIRGMRPPQDVRQWDVHGLQRAPSGRFHDMDLAAILLEATEAPAGAFGARGVPEVMRIVEIIAIEQSRQWGTCSLNEFRKFFGLKPYESFEEWNPLPEIHTAAEALYGRIDRLELHVGLQAEETKPPAPGVGLCPGYTMSRAILADAVSLTRGDRFLTLEFTPFNLTSWGYHDCIVNPKDGSYGGMLTKLLFRTLPSCYPVGSIYTHFPFFVPDYTKTRMAHQPSISAKYKWSRPIPIRQYAVVTNFMSIWKALTQRVFSPCDCRLRYVTKYPILRSEVMDTIWSDAVNVKKWGTFFSQEAERLIRTNSVSMGSGCQCIDIVEDVINILPALWFINEFVPNLAETSNDMTRPVEERELRQMFEDIGNYTLFNLDPALEWGLRESANVAASKLIELIKGALKNAKAKYIGVVDTITSMAGRSTNLPQFSTSWARALGLFVGKERSHDISSQLVALSKTLISLEDLAHNLFAEIVPTAVVFSQILTNVLNFYLHEDRESARQDLVRLLSSKDPKAHVKISAYINEAIRLDPPISAVQMIAATDFPLASTVVKSGEIFYINLREAGLDADAFGPNPQEAVYNRPEQSLLIWNLGLNGFLLSKFFEEVAPQILRSIFRLPNVRRVPGSLGQVKWILETVGDITRKLYVDAQGCTTPFAKNLMLEYDDAANSATAGN